MTDKIPAQSSDDLLRFRGQEWRVVSAPEVIERDGDAVLVEVWVRGEDIEQPK